MEGKTSTSLDDHSQTWLNLILCMAQPIFSKKIKTKLDGKQKGRLSNTWLNNDCQEVQQNYHIVLNSCDFIKTSWIPFWKVYCTIIQHRKRSYVELKFFEESSFVPASACHVGIGLLAIRTDTLFTPAPFSKGLEFLSISGTQTKESTSFVQKGPEIVRALKNEMIRSSHLCHKGQQIIVQNCTPHDKVPLMILFQTSIF